MQVYIDTVQNSMCLYEYLAIFIYYIHTYIWAINLSTMYKLGYTSKHVAAEVLCKVARLHKGL